MALKRIIQFVFLGMLVQACIVSQVWAASIQEERAFQAAQWALISSAGKALQQLGLRVAAGSGELAAAVRHRQDLVALVAEKESALGAVSSDSVSASATRLVALRGEIDSLQTEIAEVDARLAASFPRYAELANPQPLAIAEVQALLRTDEAMLVFIAGRGGSYVWAINAGSSKWHASVFDQGMLIEDITKLRAQLDPDAASRGAKSLVQAAGPRTAAFDRTTAWMLYSQLIQPVEDILAGKKHVLVVADGPLASLPLSVLVSERPPGDDTDPVALRETAWLARRHAFTTLPSVGSLSIIRGAQPLRQGERQKFAGFGAPLLGGIRAPVEVASAEGLFRGALADVDAVRDMAPLPQTGPELRRLAEAVGSGEASVYLEAQATETAVKRADLSNVDILAFATHGLLSGDLEGLGEPALVLTPPEVATTRDDGLLTASEVSELSLSAEWVILSACNTAGGDGRPDADGLSGLARAFIYAGARAILVSHWPVRDDAAAWLTTGTLSRLSANPKMGRSEALRLSMLDVMMNGSDWTLAHPSAWAPFVIVGEGGL